MNIYVTSTESGSGKTVISAGIAAVMQSFGYNAGVYKPVQTGAIDKGQYLVSPDLTFVKMLDSHITTHSSFMLKSRTIPSEACGIENVNVNIEDLKNDYTILSQKTDTLLVEATGGLMTPLNKRLFSYHLPLELNLPVLFIINPSNNSVNHYLNELNTAKTANLNILGVIINKFPVYSENPEIKTFPNIIEKYSDVKILGLIRNFKGNSVQTNVLINEILNGIDLEDVLGMKIPKLHGF